MKIVIMILIGMKSMRMRMKKNWDDELSANELAIRNYIENRHAEGVSPTIKQVQSRMKGVSLSTPEIIEIVEDLDFDVEVIDNNKTSRSEVYYRNV